MTASGEQETDLGALLGAPQEEAPGRGAGSPRLRWLNPAPAWNTPVLIALHITAVLLALSALRGAVDAFPLGSWNRNEDPVSSRTAIALASAPLSIGALTVAVLIPAEVPRWMRLLVTLGAAAIARLAGVTTAAVHRPHLTGFMVDIDAFLNGALVLLVGLLGSAVLLVLVGALMLLALGLALLPQARGVAPLALQGAATVLTVGFLLPVVALTGIPAPGLGVAP